MLLKNLIMKKVVIVMRRNLLRGEDTTAAHLSDLSLQSPPRDTFLLQSAMKAHLNHQNLRSTCLHLPFQNDEVHSRQKVNRHFHQALPLQRLKGQMCFYQRNDTGSPHHNSNLHQLKIFRRILHHLQLLQLLRKVVESWIGKESSR